MACEIEAVLDKEGFDEILSQCVRKYPILYDKRDPSFRDKIKKNSAWNNVAEELKVEGGGTVVEKLFINLRKRYNKERARIRKYLKLGIATAESEALRGEIKLKFLRWIDPFLRHRRLFSKSRKPFPDSSEGRLQLEYDEDNEVDDDDIEDEDDDSYDDEESGTEKDNDMSDAQNSTQKSRNDGPVEIVLAESLYPQKSEFVAKESGKDKHAKVKRKRDVIPEEELRVSLGAKVSKPQLVDSSYEKDECDDFVKLVASQLKTLSRMNRLIVQNSIQNTIFHAMIDEERSFQRNSIVKSSTASMLCHRNMRRTFQAHESLPPGTGNQHVTFSDKLVNKPNIQHHLN